MLGVLLGLLIVAEARGITVGRGRLSLATAGTLLMVCGAWFAIGPLAWPVVFTTSSSYFVASSHLGLLEREVGYSIGTGLILVICGAFVDGWASRHRPCLGALKFGLAGHGRVRHLKMTDLNGRANAVDALEDEDLELRRLFARLHATRDGSVHEQAEYDDLVRRTLRHVSAREAAVTEVTRGASLEGGLRRVTSRYLGPSRAPEADRPRREDVAAHPGCWADPREAFDDLHELVRLVGTEIEWDLDEALPAIRVVLAGTGREAEYKKSSAKKKKKKKSIKPGQNLQLT